MPTETNTLTFQQKISWALAVLATLILIFVVIAFSNKVYESALFPLGVTAFALAFVSILLHRRNFLGWSIFAVIVLLVVLGVITILKSNNL